MDNLIAWIESHDVAAVKFRDGILVTSWATQKIDGNILAFEITEYIPATIKAARDLLGY